MKPKYILIIVVLIVSVAGAAFLFTREEDPIITQAKEEVRRANETYFSYQNTVNAIPTLEISEDVKNDFKIQANYLGAIGSIIPDEEQPKKVITYIEKMMGAAGNRGSARFQFDFDQGMEKVSENAAKVSDVTSEDISVLEKLANTFDAQVGQAKLAVPLLAVLTAERNEKTKKYFLEFDRIDQKIKALVVSLDGYSSVDFRQKIKKLKSANEVFDRIANYTQLLIQGKARGYALGVSEVFPEVRNEENAVKICVQSNPASTCQWSGGPFPGNYQTLLQKLEPLYSQLIED